MRNTSNQSAPNPNDAFQVNLPGPSHRLYVQAADGLSSRASQYIQPQNTLHALLLSTIDRAAGMLPARSADQMKLTISVRAWLLCFLGVWLAQGASGAGDTQINSTQSQDQEHGGVAQLANGTLVFVYEDESSGTNSQILTRRFNPNLVPVGPETRVNVSTNEERSEPVVAALTGGRFVVAYTAANLDGDNYAVAFRRYDANGSALDTADVQANSLISGAQFHPQMAALTNGGFVLVWTGQSLTNQNVFYRRFDVNGSALEPNDVLANGLGNQSVTSGDQGDPAVAVLKDGSFVICYSDRSGGDVYGVRIGSDGTAFDAPGGLAGQKQFRINGATVFDQTSPAISALTNGGFVVTYSSETNGTAASRRVLGRTFSAAGVGGSENQLGAHANRWQAARLSTLANGDFVAAWQAYGEGVNADTNSWAIFAQRFSSDGTPRFLPLRVNMVNTNDQDRPFLTFLQDGNYVIAWESFGQDSSRSGIFAQTMLLNQELLPGVLTILPSVPSGGAKITFNGPAGRWYQLQGAVNLPVWSGLLTTNPPSGAFEFQVPTSLSSQVFRVQSL